MYFRKAAPNRVGKTYPEAGPVAESLEPPESRFGAVLGIVGTSSPQRGIRPYAAPLPKIPSGFFNTRPETARLTTIMYTRYPILLSWRRPEAGMPEASH